MMLSAPVPPKTRLLPPASVMKSAPPSVSVVTARVTVPETVKVIVPWSPSTRVGPVPEVMVSDPAPPITVLKPLPRAIVSASPITPRDLAKGMLPFRLKVTWALSPKAAVLPVPEVIRSSPVPPMAKFAPSPAMSVSLPPTPGVRESASVSVPPVQVI